jgi:hypothetical protein
MGVYRTSNGLTYLKNVLSDGFADVEFYYGTNQDIAISGVWVAGPVPVVGPAVAPTPKPEIAPTFPASAGR